MSGKTVGQRPADYRTLTVDWPADVHAIATGRSRGGRHCPAKYPARIPRNGRIIAGPSPRSLHALSPNVLAIVGVGPRGVRALSASAASPCSYPVRDQNHGLSVSGPSLWQVRQMSTKHFADFPAAVRTVFVRCPTNRSTNLRRVLAAVRCTTAPVDNQPLRSVRVQAKSVRSLPTRHSPSLIHESYLPTMRPSKPQCVPDDPEQTSRPITIVKPSVPRAWNVWLARAVNVVRPAARRLHIDCARFAKDTVRLRGTLGVCISGLKPLCGPMICSR